MRKAFDPAFIESVRSQLAKGPIPHYIGGEFVESAAGETFETLDPATNRGLARVARGRPADVARAVAAAREAFDRGPWPRMPARERRRYLLRVAELIERHADELSVLECLDTGQVLKIIRGGQIPRAAENFRFYAEAALSAFDGETYPVDDRFLYYTFRQPVGVAGLITPWNTPLMLATWKLAPCLAAGNTCVLKPAEWSPLSAWFLARIFAEADLPPGVVNVVQGYGEEAGAPLVADARVQLISFTGETTTGKIIMRTGAESLKRYSFELGGKSPAVVFADADLERAVDGVVFQIFSLNGERCTANSRLLVERSVYPEFVERVAARAGKIRVGHPLNPDSEVGPLIHPEHLARVEGFVEEAKREGARVLAGGHRVGEEGNYYAPTVLEARPGMRIEQEEVFGPVLVAMPFGGEEEALQIANGVRYGLAAYVWTRDVERAHRFAREVEAGMVWINSHNVRHLPTPFGGMKESGIGREGGRHSFHFYTEEKVVMVPLGAHPIPKFGKEA